MPPPRARTVIPRLTAPDCEDLPFPKSLDIPRLPAPLMSPFLVVDLALGELFQDRWKTHSLAESYFVF